MSEGPLASREATGSPINSSIVWTALTVTLCLEIRPKHYEICFGYPRFRNRL